MESLLNIVLLTLLLAGALVFFVCIIGLIAAGIEFFKD
jgi:hypothetical protein